MVVSQQESGSTPVMIGSESDAQIIWKQQEVPGYRRDPLKKRQGGLHTFRVTTMIVRLESWRTEVVESCATEYRRQ